MCYVGARIPAGEGTILGLSPLKCIKLCKQQTPAAARGCRLVRRTSASCTAKARLRMDSPAAWLTGAGAAFRQKFLTMTCYNNLRLTRFIIVCNGMLHRFSVQGRPRDFG